MKEVYNYSDIPKDFVQATIFGKHYWAVRDAAKANKIPGVYFKSDPKNKRGNMFVGRAEAEAYIDRIKEKEARKKERAVKKATRENPAQISESMCTAIEVVNQKLDRILSRQRKLAEIIYSIDSKHVPTDF